MSMLKNSFLFVLLILMLFSCVTQNSIQTEDNALKNDEEVVMENMDAAGIWEGQLVLGNVKLRIRFNVVSELRGYSATLDSLDQGAYGLPVDNFKVQGSHVSIEMKLLKATFEGDFLSNNKIEGVFIQAGQKMDLILQRPNTEKEDVGSQNTSNYIVEEIEFFNALAGITLRGVLTYPKKSKPNSAIIFISGSGPQNRDEEILGHKPFAVLGDALTEAGYAVLRFDDRGVGESEGNFSLATSLDFKTDVEAAYDYLINRADFGFAQIGLLGHSEGGMIAPFVAQDKPVDFLILLAAPAFSGEDLMYQQTEALLKASGADEAQIQQVVSFNSSIYRIAMSSSNDEEAKEKIENLLKQYGLPQDQIDIQVAQVLSPWYKTFLMLDPYPAFTDLSIPVLALYGSLDTQVPAEINASHLEQALEKSDSSGFRIEILEGLNHLFQPATTGLPQEYQTIEITIDESAIKAILNFMETL